MSIVKRAEHWWFRKSVPVDIARIAGVPELRRSLRTRDAALARRRALQFLVRVDEVYAILRSKKPLKPIRDLALSLLDEALRLNVGTPGGFARKAEFLKSTRGVIENLPLDHALGEHVWDGDDDTQARLITRSDAFGILRTERPAAKDNEVALSILEAVDQISSRPWTTRRTGKQALDRAMDLLATTTATSEPAQAGDMLDMFRSTVVAELAAARMASPPAFDVAALQDLVASEIRSGIAQAESSRWSDEPLSAAIKRYEEQEVIKLTGLKHAEDVPKRLANFLNFIGDRPVRDIARDDLKDYRDHLDRLPDRFQLRFKISDIRKTISLNQMRLRPFATIGPKTVDLKYIGPVRRFFEWLVTETKIENNPAKDIHSGQIVVDAVKGKRLPLKPDQISRLFTSTAKEPKTSALYWLPPLMLFTGARLNDRSRGVFWVLPRPLGEGLGR